MQPLYDAITGQIVVPDVSGMSPEDQDALVEQFSAQGQSVSTIPPPTQITPSVVEPLPSQRSTPFSPPAPAGPVPQQRQPPTMAQIAELQRQANQRAAAQVPIEPMSRASIIAQGLQQFGALLGGRDPNQVMAASYAQQMQERKLARQERRARAKQLFDVALAQMGPQKDTRTRLQKLYDEGGWADRGVSVGDFQRMMTGLEGGIEMDVGGNIPLDKPNMREQQANAVDAASTIASIDAIMGHYRDEFSTYRTRAKSFFSDILEKAELPGNEEWEKLAEDRAYWLIQSKMLAQQVRLQLTGQAAAVQELQRIEKMLPGETDSASMYRAKMRSFRETMERQQQIARYYVIEGVPPLEQRKSLWNASFTHLPKYVTDALEKAEQQQGQAAPSGTSPAPTTAPPAPAGPSPRMPSSIKPSNYKHYSTEELWNIMTGGRNVDYGSPEGKAILDEIDRIKGTQ